MSLFHLLGVSGLILGAWIGVRIAWEAGSLWIGVGAIVGALSGLIAGVLFTFVALTIAHIEFRGRDALSRFWTRIRGKRS